MPVGSIDPLQLDILVSPSILQKFYELNSGKYEGAEDLSELIRDTEENIEARRSGSTATTNRLIYSLDTRMPVL